MNYFLLLIALIGGVLASPVPAFDWLDSEDIDEDLSKEVGKIDSAEDLPKNKTTEDQITERFPPCGPKDEIDDVTWVYSEKFKSCYLVLEQMNFEDAEEICQEQKSHLVSIHSADENKFVASLVFDNVTRSFDRDALLLGARKVNGAFEWLDGSELDFQVWAAGEPNNQKPTSTFPELDLDEQDLEAEKCLAMYTNPISYLASVEHLYRWNDNICSGFYEYAMCKKAADY